MINTKKYVFNFQTATFVEATQNDEMSGENVYYLTKEQAESELYAYCCFRVIIRKENTQLETANAWLDEHFSGSDVTVEDVDRAIKFFLHKMKKIKKMKKNLAILGAKSLGLKKYTFINGGSVFSGYAVPWKNENVVWGKLKYYSYKYPPASFGIIPCSDFPSRDEKKPYLIFCHSMNIYIDRRGSVYDIYGRLLKLSVDDVLCDIEEFKRKLNSGKSN